MSEDADAGVRDDVQTPESGEDHGSCEDSDLRENGDNLNVNEERSRDLQDEISSSLKQSTRSETINHEARDQQRSASQNSGPSEIGGKNSPLDGEENKNESSDRESEYASNIKEESTKTQSQPPVDQEMENEDNLDDQDEDDLKRCKSSGGFTGRGVTLQMLLADQILTPKENSMSLEYMGQKFVGDLLADGRIRSAEVQEVFSSPSAWALRCKKIVNPEQKYGCGWSSVSSKRSIFDVRYCGRPLDVYKNQWMRKRRLEQTTGENLAGDGGAMSSIDRTIASESRFKLVSSNRPIVKHETFGNRAAVEDPSVLVDLLSFASCGKLQPFLVSLHTSALVVMDVHCSLTSSEVVGYLGGLWDMNNNTLTVKRCYPGLSRLADSKRGQACEMAIAREMERDGLVLVGWYHSHPLAAPTPTVLDIDAQMDYQLKLKGAGELGYRPCIGIICSPYYRDPNESSESTSYPMNCFWVSPPPESRPLEVARPMSMQHNVVVDPSIEEDVINTIETCVKFYKDLPDRICFDEAWNEGVTILDNLKASLTSKLRDENDIAVVDLLEDLLGSKPRAPAAKKMKTDLSPKREKTADAEPDLDTEAEMENEPTAISEPISDSVVAGPTQTGVSCM